MVGPRQIEPKAIRFGTKEELVQAFVKAGYEIVSTSLPGVEYGLKLRKKARVRNRLRLEDYARVEIYTTLPEDLNVVMKFPLMRGHRYSGRKIVVNKYQSKRHECHMSYIVTKEGLVPKGIQTWDRGV